MLKQGLEQSVLPLEAATQSATEYDLAALVTRSFKDIGQLRKTATRETCPSVLDSAVNPLGDLEESANQKS